MKRSLVWLVLILLPCSNIFAQVYEGEIDSIRLPAEGAAHYIPEYTFDAPVNPGTWKKEEPGMHVSFGSERQLYFRTEVPSFKSTSLSWKGIGWRGERLNTQIVVWSPDTLRQVRFVVSDLRSKDGHLISGRNIHLNKVCYVIANYPYGSDKPDCGPTPYKDGFLMPDRFEAFDRFDVPGRTVRPVWVSVNLPRNAKAGDYRGSIVVNAKGFHIVLAVEIVVQNQVLPAPHDWHYQLDLWQNPWIIAEYYHVEPWGREFDMLLRQHLRLYADAGGSSITTYGVYSPWGDNEYGIEKSMIKWEKQADGVWKFDYHIFDEYVELAMSMGIDKAITIYTPLPYNYRFRYLDESTGNYVYAWWPPTSDAFKTVWGYFLSDLKLHLEKKGWFKKTYIGLNESDLTATMAAIKVIRDNSRDWKIAYAGDWHKDLDTLVNNYSCVYGEEATIDEVRARARRGDVTTYYVCCHPARPNTFLFSPPVEARWISWYAAAHDYNGFLRWAYDAWPEDPLRDSRFGSWAAGDCYLVYPGGNSCIRFEKLREGIVDCEKIHILRLLAAASSNKRIRELMDAFNANLITINNGGSLDRKSLEKEISKGVRMIDNLSEMLADSGARVKER